MLSPETSSHRSWLQHCPKKTMLPPAITKMGDHKRMITPLMSVHQAVPTIPHWQQEQFQITLLMMSVLWQKMIMRTRTVRIYTYKSDHITIYTCWCSVYSFILYHFCQAVFQRFTVMDIFFLSLWTNLPTPAHLKVGILWSAPAASPLICPQQTSPSGHNRGGPKMLGCSILV